MPNSEDIKHHLGNYARIYQKGEVDVMNCIAVAVTITTGGTENKIDEWCRV